jgi:hypothetical protein
MSDSLRSPKLKSWHLDRQAIVYVRQSTPQQVADHKESTARQYALVDRAVALGWARGRVGVSRDTIRGWVRRGWVATRRDSDGHHVIWADADELRRLGQLPGLRPSWANKEKLAALRRPKPRPA